MRTLVAALIVLLFTPVSALYAQGPQTIEPGTRVRLSAPDHDIRQLEVTLHIFRGDTIVVTSEGSLTSLPLSSVTSLEAYRGTVSHGGQFAVIGALVGVVGGGAAGVGAAIHQDAEEPPLELAVLGAAGGGLLFGVLGYVIGSGVEGERWEEIRLDRLRLSFAPQRDGFAFGVTVRF